MKNLNRLILILLFGCTQLASAFTYTNTQLLLIFRQDGFKDVEFNLGSVSNFTTLSAGTTVTVTNWSPTAVSSNYNNSLSGAKFILVACTDRSLPNAALRCWLTDADAATSPNDVTGSKLTTQLSLVNSIGSAAAVNSTDTTQTYVIDSTLTSSYTDIVSSGGSLDLPTFGGNAAFTVEQSIPGSSRFFALKIGSGSSTQIGTFTMTSNGTLTFTAGTAVPLVQPRILSITRTNGISSVSFASVTGLNYRLRAINALTTSVTNWTILSPAISGNNSVVTLQETTGVSTRFYNVEAFQ